ncbi:MBL fold metallo-hydrolase [Nakamurella deserti]|uniref:MBL fold metallo-hydrolase n=1 Tax=Nakamurella deserti TaxID=2164074 RepID=UPI001F0C8F6D|nr:MBL fold metallo-hydrolase [Nakamurella deserti]
MNDASGVRPRTALTGSRLAPNAGPMTLDGTNSYVLSGPGSASVIVVDPGPLDETHLADLAARPVELVLITHHHLDHTAASERFAALTGAPVRALDPAFCVGGASLTDGEVIEAAGVHVQVLATPGHTADSVCFLLRDDVAPDGRPTGSVLTGDTILGRGTTILAHPDGRLGDYLASLERLAALGPATVLPAHGPVLPDLAAVVGRYREHRLARLAAVEAAVAAVGDDVVAVTDAVYTDIDDSVRPAAERSVAAQLEYLRSR